MHYKCLRELLLCFGQRQPQAACTPEGLVCASKLHGAKIDCPAVAGLSFFAIRWRTKLHPETIIKVRSGLFSSVLFFFLIKQKCVKVSA